MALPDIDRERQGRVLYDILCNVMCSESNSLTNSLTPTFVGVTPSTNFVVDTNNTRRIGNLIVVYVKGHSTGTLTNGVMFSLDTTASIRNGSSTFPMGVGGDWSITEIGYGFFNSETKNFATQNLASGKYVHVHYVAVVS